MYCVKDELMGELEELEQELLEEQLLDVGPSKGVNLPNVPTTELPKSSKWSSNFIILFSTFKSSKWSSNFIILFSTFKQNNTKNTQYIVKKRR